MNTWKTLFFFLFYFYKKLREYLKSIMNLTESIYYTYKLNNMIKPRNRYVAKQPEDILNSIIIAHNRDLIFIAA